MKHEDEGIILIFQKITNFFLSFFLKDLIISNLPDISFWTSLFVRKSIRGKLKALPEPATSGFD